VWKTFVVFDVLAIWCAPHSGPSVCTIAHCAVIIGGGRTSGG
jgi:hypothetical protein